MYRILIAWKIQIITLPHNSKGHRALVCLLWERLKCACRWLTQGRKFHSGLWLHSWKIYADWGLRLTSWSFQMFSAYVPILAASPTEPQHLSALFLRPFPELQGPPSMTPIVLSTIRSLAVQWKRKHFKCVTHRFSFYITSMLEQHFRVWHIYVQTWVVTCLWLQEDS